MSHKGHEGTPGWQGSQDPNDVPADVYGFGPLSDDDKIEKMVEGIMKSMDFDSVLNNYYDELTEQIAVELKRAQDEMPAGQSWNLHSEAACKQLADKVVNNVLRVPHDDNSDSDKPLVSGQGVWEGGEEVPF